MPRYKKEYLRTLASFSSLGIEMGANVGIGFLIGKYVDKFFETEKIFTVLFTFFGIVAGFKALYMAAKKLEKDFKEKKFDNVFDDDDSKKS